MYPDKKIRDDKGKQIATLRFRTLSEMREGIEASRDDDARCGLSSQRACSEGGWTGTKDAQEYIDMLRDGWPLGIEGVEGLDGLSTDLRDDYAFSNSVCGTYLDVPAYQAGVPDCMLEYRSDPSELQGLTLVIDSCYSACVDGETVLEYARSVMRLVAWLSAERIECAVYVVCPIQLGRKRVIYTTPIRRAGDVLQPERLAAIVHPSWLRRAWFAMVERDYYDRKHSECRACTSGYGSVRHATADEVRQCVPEAYSVIMLPKVGSGDPMQAVQESVTLKLRAER